MKKYFDILGLKEDCEQELIKVAYKTLIHKYVVILPNTKI